VWWQRAREPDPRTLNDLIRFLMQMDAKLDAILDEVRDVDAEEE